MGRGKYCKITEKFPLRTFLTENFYDLKEKSTCIFRQSVLKSYTV